MIEHLHIENFKSIRNLDIDCKRVNVFIGEPNTGKSNILEALGFFSPGTLKNENFKEAIRFGTIMDLFFDNDTSKPIIVSTKNLEFELGRDRNADGLPTANFKVVTTEITQKGKEVQFECSFNYDGNPHDQKFSIFDPLVRTYIFKRLDKFELDYRPYLSTPFGRNLANLVLTNPEMKSIVSAFFRGKGFRLQLKPSENDINMAKEVDDEIYSYPYHTISETMQRIVFIMMAMESNKNATLIFDEPETQTFPINTKFIGERIALDKSNQYFITTHNPYLLSSIIQKTSLNDLSIFVAKMENYETKLVLMTTEQIEEALGNETDIFFNLARIIGE